ncbi:hypothetical protein [Flavobacterium sp.]|uniref:hypothetical protein n=1 Tax=Flavobacterium sp. TaxID=239 RepID=UPI0025E3A645|nr:hypothetical protein [Flavobacterium sp.]
MDIDNRIEKKTNYFYIDESGNISNNSDLFIHGCIKTDSPETIKDALEKLKADLLDDLYYEDFKGRIQKEGFHATENNFDMRADFYKLLPLLDYRSYFVVINKNTDYFRELKNKKEEHEIFKYSLEQLLLDRINRNKGDRNIFIFEQIEISKKSLKTILDEIFGSLDNSHNCEYKIVGKEEENLGVVDYINFIFFHILSVVDSKPRMKQNFKIVAPKIAIVKLLHNKVYLSRKKKQNHKVTLDNLIREFSG